MRVSGFGRALGLVVLFAGTTATAGAQPLFPCAQRIAFGENGWRCSIPFFSRSHRVIAADNRAHGRSDDGSGPLTYEQIADDLAAVLDDAKSGPVDILGHSDGGILGLLLAIRHPSKVNKLVASGPNLRPDSTAVADWFIPETTKVRDNADDDSIKAEHLLEIYRSIPKAQLGIVPGGTHFFPFQLPDLYNGMAERFLRQPFTRPSTKEVLFGAQ